MLQGPAETALDQFSRMGYPVTGPRHHNPIQHPSIMSISSDQVTYIARLARLRTNEEKSTYFAGHLSRIMDLVEQMNQIDTDHIEPMAHPQDGVLRLREDMVTAENLRDDYQSIAPAAQDGLYLVPRVIE